MAAQVDALNAAGCRRIYKETASGARNDRPVLADLMANIRAGDILVSYKLDRIARSLPHLLEIMDHLGGNDIGFKSITEDINTTTPGGRLVFHVMAAISQFERDLIRERTNAGLQAARARGRVGGRPRKMTDEKVQAAERLLSSGTPVRDVAEMFNVSVPTLYRWCPGTGR
jgi:DNA invertase Pin-like site-specific DNA recombinase